jgi:hypothetical protein
VFLSHFCPDAQPAQTAPPAPHAPSDWDPNWTQVEPLQQPFWQEVPPQAHCPLLVSQCWPDPQAAQVAPPAPHFPADWAE